MAIGLKELKEKYDYGEAFFRTVLCRPEFNKFRTDKFFVFNDTISFYKILNETFKLKKSVHSAWRLRFVLLFLLFNTQLAFCQHYEPVIIYSPSGEPQVMIKGHIKYTPHGEYTK